MGFKTDELTATDVSVLGNFYASAFTQAQTAYFVYYNPTTKQLTYDVSTGGGGGTGDVGVVGTPAVGQVAVWVQDASIEGTSELTYSGGSLDLGFNTNDTGQITSGGFNLIQYDDTNNAIYVADKSIEIFADSSIQMSISNSGLITFNSNAGGGGTTNFLRADGTWAAPSGGGTIGGSIANYQIAYGSVVSNEIEGNSTLTYDGSGALTIDSSGSAELHIDRGILASTSSLMRWYTAGTAQYYMGMVPSSGNFSFYSNVGSAEIFNVSSTTEIVNFTAGITFNDNIEAKFGTGADMSLDHDGTHFILNSQSGTGQDILFQTQTTTRFTFDNGTYKGTAVDWIATSDARLKENIRPYGNVLDKISKLKGSLIHFDWINENKNDIGMIAQEIKPYFPEFVQEDAYEKDGEKYMALSYSKMSAIALEGIAELRDEKNIEIENLKKELLEIKKELNNLKNLN